MIIVKEKKKVEGLRVKRINYTEPRDLCASFDSNGQIMIRNGSPFAEGEEEIIYLGRDETLALIRLFTEMKID